jgi:hypothetical protein
LKAGVVLALDFLAKQLGLSDLIDRVHEIIHSVRQPIVSAIEWVLGKVKPFVTKLTPKGRQTAPETISPGPAGAKAGSASKEPTKATHDEELRQVPQQQRRVDEREKDRVAALAREQERAAAARNLPVAGIVALLDGLKTPYPWIQRFEIRPLRNGFAIHMIASDKKIGEVIPHTTEEQRPIIDAYVGWLAKYRTKINEVHQMVERGEKLPKVSYEAGHLYRAPQKRLTDIETEVKKTRGDAHLEKLMESLFKERQHLDSEAEAVRQGGKAYGVTGRTISKEGKPFVEYQAVKKANELAGATVSQVQQKLGPHTDADLSPETGRRSQTWKFRDKSSIRLDIPAPGLENIRNVKFQASLDPHIAIYGPHDEVLSRQGVVVPPDSEPAHSRIFRG